MSRITLIHWNAPEAQARAAQLERAGHSVTVHADRRAAPLTPSPPDVFVIDLNRLPSHGRETGVWLRNQNLLFVTSQARLANRFASAARLLSEGGRLWIVWPKKASGVPTDLTENAVRQFGLSAGLVDWKISAIDATWSGLCFARRRHT